MAQFVIKSSHGLEDESGDDTIKKFAFGEYMGWAYIDAYINIFNEKSIGDNARIVKR